MLKYDDKKRSMIIVSLFMLNVATCLAWSPGARADGTKMFEIYNATQYRSTPDLAPYGFKNLPLHGGDLMVRTKGATAHWEYSADAARATAVKQAAQPVGLFAMDIEQFGLGPEGVDKYVNTIGIVRKYNRHTEMGAYGYMPINTAILYDSIAKHSSGGMKQYEQMQEQAEPIGRALDVLMPSFYTYGDDMAVWDSMVKQAVAFDRKNYPGKKIYAFIWPQYNEKHASRAATTALGLTFLPASVWRHELDTLYPLVDGVVIWSGWKDHDGKDVVFSKDMPWFQQTIQFMKVRGLH